MASILDGLSECTSMLTRVLSSDAASFIKYYH